jgi:hypothetical protein
MVTGRRDLELNMWPQHSVSLQTKILQRRNASVSAQKTLSHFNYGSFSDFSEQDCGILLYALNVHYIGNNNFFQLTRAMHLAANYN